MRSPCGLLSVFFKDKIDYAFDVHSSSEFTGVKAIDGCVIFICNKSVVKEAPTEQAKRR